MGRYVCMEKRQSKTRRVTSLEGLRALAIIAIVIYHLKAKLLPGGYFGVTIFFVLSGYLITESVLRQIDRSGTVDFKRYWAHRLRRLWPVMIAVIAVTAILSAIFARELLTKMRPDILPSLFFFDNWWYVARDLSYFEAMGARSPLTHYWYLGVLVQLYFVWPLILLAMQRFSPSRSVDTRITLVLAAISTVLMAVLFALEPNGDSTRVYYGCDTRAAEFLIGAALAMLWSSNDFRESPESSWRPALHDVVALVAMIVLLAFMVNINGYSHFPYFGGFLITAIISAVLIGALVVPGGLVSWVLSLPPLQWLGKRSFGLYLWHYPLFALMNPINSTAEKPWWLYLIQVVVVLVVAEASYRFIEQPFGNGQVGAFFRGLRDREFTIPEFVQARLIPSAAYCGVLVVAALVIALVPDAEAIGGLEKLKETQSNVEATSVAAPTPSEATSTASEAVTLPEGVSGKKVLLIGDSVAETASSQFYDVFPYGRMDAVIGRQMYEGDRVYLDNANDYAADIVVYCLGSNGVCQERNVTTAIDAVGDDRPIYLVNIRVPDDFQDINNEMLAQIADRYPNVTLLDWYGASTGHDEWFDGDGEHLTPLGAENYIDLIYTAIEG